MTNTENVTITAATYDGVFKHPEMAFRVLSWLERAIGWDERGADLSGYSTKRQESMADLVRAGLVVERTYTGGDKDGLVTLQISAEGRERLQTSWLLAGQVITAPVSAPTEVVVLDEGDPEVAS